MKRKPCSSLVIHAAPLHEVQDQDISGDSKEISGEKLEMTTFGKSESKKYNGKLTALLQQSVNKNNIINFLSLTGAVVSIDRFDKHVEKMHEDRDKLFETEYAVRRSSYS